MAMRKGAKKKVSDADEGLAGTVIMEVNDDLPAPVMVKGKASLDEKVEKTKIERGKSYIMDLRIHSPASLGYMSIEGIDTAPAVVRLAKVKGLDMIAVTDYYSGNFVDPIINAAQGKALTVIPGTVIRCKLGDCSDVTLLCLFPESFSTGKIEEFLIKIGVPQTVFGDWRYLVDKPLEIILKHLEDVGGVALPSRMDKTPNRKSVIPLLVEDYGFRAFDLAYPDSVKYFHQMWPRHKFKLFSFSNANALAQVGSRIAKVEMRTPGFEGVKNIIQRRS